MDKTDSISVVIPTYNRSHLLVRAIRSALDQTFPPLEVIVCDDGSTDDTQAVVEQLNEPKVKYLPCGRWGRPAGPRNLGVKAAQGNWVAFLDSDDAWTPNKLEHQMACLKHTGDSASCTNALRVVAGQDETNYLSFVPVPLSFQRLLETNFVICSSMLVKRELVERCGGFPESPALRALEDYALWLRLATNTNVSYLSEALVRYNDEPSTSIRSEDVDAKEQKRRVLNDLVGWLGQSNTPDNGSLQMAKRVLHELDRVTASNSMFHRILRRLFTR